jgi:hypothetical protein
MQSWTLEKFVKLNGLVYTGKLWGVSHQAVSGAIKSNRTINITLIDGEYEIFETKRLKKGVK